MTSVRHSRLLQFTGLVLSALIWLANNGNPPTGSTGAPFDGTCAQSNCHNDGNPNGFDGDVAISGLPGTIEANTTYPITLTMTITAGSPTKGGFQIVAVDGSNANAGDFTTANAQTGTEMLNSREYLEHRNGKAFSGGTVSWDFNWKSPASGVSGNTIKFYYIGNFTNSNNQRFGDFPKAFSDTYAFNGPPPVTATITSTTNVSCNGGNNGSATAEGGGGVAPYTYKWSNNQTSATINNLVAGTYTVTVTGSSNSGTATASATITQPPVLTLSASVNGTLTCTNTGVTATATAGGGTPGYEYAWSDGQAGPTASFDTPGSYTVVVTDANGCTKAAAVTVNQNITPPTATVAPGGTLTCTVTQLTLSGSGSSTGPNFSYLWTTVGGNIVSGQTTLSPVVNGCGLYILTVTNIANNCTASASTTVDCAIDPPNISVSNNGPLTCARTTVILSGNSTTPGVTYLWTGPNGFTSSDQNPTTAAPGIYTLVVSNPENNCSSSASTTVTQNTVVPTDTANVSGIITCLVDSVHIFMNTNISNATFQWIGPNGFTSTQKRDTIGAPGDYIGIVTNPVNGCKSRDTVTVIQNTNPPGATAGVSGQITCVTPSVQLQGGPSGANTYTWKGPNSYSSTDQNPTTTQAGNYTLVVRSTANGCTSVASVAVIQNTAAPTVSIAPPGNLNCNNATVQINATGSSQGASFTYLWTTANGHIESGQTTLTPIVSAAGIYNLLITNTENGCVANGSAAVIQSPAVGASISSSTNVSCNGGANGSANATATGGNGAYTYLWSTGATTSGVNGLTAGTYVFTVTDGENCTASASAVITQPDPLAVNASATGETALGANNGTATAAPTGGTQPYGYAWSTGANTATITGLAPGSYTVSVIDANGCNGVQTVTVNAFGCSLNASISGTNATCNGANDGSAVLTISGAADPVSFQWSNGATTQNVTGLAPGTYTVGILDGNNCPAILNIQITEPTALAANASSTSETGAGANDGTASATPTGGSGDYTYLWSTGATTSSISGLAPGTYTVSVSDANHCTAVQSVTVTFFNCALDASISGANVSCHGLNDGQATVGINGGQLPYTYIWSNGATTATITNLTAGVYTVSATDNAGCVVIENIAISQPDQLAPSVNNVQNVTCVGDHTGSAEISAEGGKPPYTFTGSFNNLGVGQHTVVVTDAGGCTANAVFTISATDSEAPVVSCPSNIILCGADIINYPAPTATDNCGVNGPVVLISGKASGSVFDDGVTVQVFRATDTNGNTGTCTFSVTVFPIPDIIFDGSTNDHNGQGTGSISITAIGGSGSGYIYVWNKNGQFFSTNEDLTGLNAGNYTLTVTDGNGCTSALSPITITNSVGTDEPGETGSIRLFPNPVGATFKLIIIDLDVVAARILDTRGRWVYELKENEWLEEVTVDQLATGVYFLKLTTADGHVRTLRFVKSN